MGKYVGGYATRQCKHNPIAEGFAKGLEAFAQGLAERQRKQQDEETIEQMNNPDLTDMERAKLSMKLSPQGQKSVMNAMELYNKLSRRQNTDEELAYKKEREGRIKQEHDAEDLDRLYKTELKDLQDRINDTPLERDKKALKDQRSSLKKERAVNISKLKKGEEPVLDYLTFGKEKPVEAQRQGFDTMNQMGAGPNANIQGATPGINPYAENSTTSFTPNAPQNVASNATNLRQQAPQAQQGAVTPTTTQPQKVRWDKSNPEHQAFAAKVFQETGNDRAKTNAILAEQFEK